MVDALFLHLYQTLNELITKLSILRFYTIIIIENHNSRTLIFILKTKVVVFLRKLKLTQF